MKRAALHNLGCKVNAYETEAMQQMLEEEGYEIVPFQEKADVYVINTCSVTNMADRKSRQMLHRARRLNPNAVIVAVGCYVQASGKELLEEGIADIILGNNKKQHLIPMLREYGKSRKLAADVADINCGKRGGVKNGIPDSNFLYEPLSITRAAGHTRAFIKIQDGCDQFCSYCIIPYVRGRVRSRKKQDILAEIKALASNGYQEVVLTGIHLSSYGIDLGESLLDLVTAINGIPGIQRIRLGSLEPKIITEEFVRGLAAAEKICPHFHLSLQSGCDSVLKRMNRKYDTQDYQARCDILRKHFSDPAITTDIIVGFPGETEEEFQETKRFLEQVHFYEMHIFKYSKRKGTKAADMDGQVPEDVKAGRSAQLLELGRRMSKEYREHFCGRLTSVLLEEPFTHNGTGYYVGYTKEYVKIAVPSDADRSNCIVRGKISGQLAKDIYLMVEF